MGLPDFAKIEQGTAVIWGEAGATGGSLTVTKTLTFEALANNSGRMGASADLGATFDEEYEVFLIVETGTAPTAGNYVELFMACSFDNVNWPGKVTGSDAAYPSSVDENKKQLELICVLSATNDTNTVLKQAPVIWRPTSRYVAPVVVNKLGQAIRDETTATDNDSRVVLVPRRLLVQDSA